jgi:RNA polymerase sigma factor (sigma-70 family)
MRIVRHLTLQAPLPHDEQRALVALAQAGDAAARAQLVATTRRMVAKFAWRASRSHRGVEVEDLMNAGELGVSIAITRFDLSRPWNFATYAVWWIRASVTNAAVEMSGGKRADTSKFSLYKRLLTLMREGRTAQQAADALSAEPDGKHRPDTLLSLYYRLASDRITFSLQETITEDGVERQDLIAADTQPVDEQLIDRSDRRQVFEAVAAFRETLTPRNRAIFDGRFWPADGEPKTLQEVAEGLGITRERVRQIEVVLRRLARARLGAVLGRHVDELDGCAREPVSREAYRRRAPRSA